MLDIKHFKHVPDSGTQASYRSGANSRYDEDIELASKINSLRKENTIQLTD